MAIKKQYAATVPVQMTDEMKERIRAVSDHPRINDSLASVIRDCIDVALPSFELELELREIDDLTDGERQVLGLDHLTREEKGPEDRAKGSFGWVAPQG